MKYGFVYKTTNNLTGAMYIGKHKRTQNINDPDDSWYLGSGKLLLLALNKYGIENFSRVILDECDTEEELQEKERFRINEVNAVENSNYYNLVEDANPPILSGDKAPMRNPEVAKKVSTALSGRVVSKDTCMKISGSCKSRQAWVGSRNPQYGIDHTGINNSFYGKTHTDESKKKMSESRKELLTDKTKHPMYGKHHNEETKNKISSKLKGSKVSEDTKIKLSSLYKTRVFTKVCLNCGKEYTTNGTRSKYCSIECKYEFYKRGNS